MARLLCLIRMVANLMSGNHGGVYADGKHDGLDADEDEEDADEADDNVCEDEVSSKSSQQS